MTRGLQRPEAFSGLQVAPSILSADFSRLGEQVALVMEAGARVIHFDVMDGKFVPPITIGPLVLEALAGPVHDSGGALDVHLMIESPEQQFEDFARAGADSITFHVEATAHANRALAAVRDLGCLAGIALNPGTPVEVIEPLVDWLDIVLVMSVNPGWGGQSYIEGSEDRIARVRELAPEVLIEVDGGIDPQTAPAVSAEGASLLVAGSAIFGAEDPVEAFRAIRAAAESTP